MTLTDECELFLRQLISKRVEESDDDWLEVRGGDLESEIGWTKRMPMVCAAMRKVQQACDEVIYEPPMAKGNNLRIRYSLKYRRSNSTPSPAASESSQITSPGIPDHGRVIKHSERLAPLDEDEKRVSILLSGVGAELASDEPFGADHERELRELSILIRRGQPAFRRALFAAYDGKCALSGCDVAEALEAAHIVPYSEGGNSEVSNGVLLRADLHTLLDDPKNLLKLRVTDEGTIEVEMADALESHYGALAFRMPRNADHAPSHRAIEYRWMAHS